MKLLQPSCTGGELSPSCYGRVDLARYAVSLKTCRNFIVRPYGGISNRAGSIFVNEAKSSARPVRLIPFIVSTDTAYVIELGSNYARFYADGALVLSGSSPFELATPWPITDAVNIVSELDFTQSVDVMTLTHRNYPPQQISRLTATTFSIAEFSPRNGPFRSLNANESILMYSSAITGEVTITSSAPAFTSGMVGGLLYLEQRDLRGVAPWEPGQRNVAVGTLCRSDGKIYKCSSVPSTSGLAGTPWYQNGSTRPSHDNGRAYDGPQDTRTDGTNQYKVGVEWEYQNGGYGIVEITGYTSSTVVTGDVVSQLPESVVGGGGVLGTYSLAGDGVTTSFALTGATSVNAEDYSVVVA